MKVIVTGGAGFVGSHLCRSFREHYPQAEVVAFDNLRRRGSELNLADFKRRGIQFVHGDIRHLADLQECGSGFDLMIEASAEPSVLAGQGGDTSYLIDTNLVGTRNALEFARKSVARTIFLSSSRVYSIAPLRDLKFKESATRLELETSQSVTGVSSEGVREDFPVDSARSLYGATKLCSEYLVQEYAFSFGLKAVVNRCGVIAGPGQFGKVDQGIFTLWVARHHFKKGLQYTGFGGKGLQVRDLMHPADLFDLVHAQSQASDEKLGGTYNAGGGPREGSVSLLELTALCERATGNKISMGSDPKTAPVDIPWFVCDNSRVRSAFGWAPKRNAATIVNEIAAWVRENEDTLQHIF